MLFFRCSVMYDSLQPHGLQHARLPCPSQSPRACSNSCPLSQWCHPTISSSPSLPEFYLSQYQGIFQWVSSSYQVAKLLKLQQQSFQWIFRIDFLLGLTGLILQSKGLSRIFANITVRKHQFFSFSYDDRHNFMPGHIRCQRILHSFWNIMTHTYRDIRFSSVQSHSRVRLFATPWIAAYQASLSITNSRILSKLMSIESVMPSNHLILCHPLLLLPSPQSFQTSGSFQMSQFFTSGGQRIGVSASTSVLPMNTQGWFTLAWTGWISLQSKALSRVFFKESLLLLLTWQCFPCSLTYQVNLISLTNF